MSNDERAAQQVRMAMPLLSLSVALSADDTAALTKFVEEVYSHGAAWGQARAAIAQQPRMTVRLQSFPESNGKRNWTAMIVRVDEWDGLIGNCGGVTVARGELWNRVAYEAERAKFLLGERDDEPDILDYGDDIKTPEEWRGEVIGGRPVQKGAAIAQPAEPAHFPQQVPNEFGHLLTTEALWRMYVEDAPKAAQADAQPVAPSTCGLTECKGQPKCRRCLSWDAADAKGAAAPPARQPQWMPIETAPRDGADVLLTNGKSVSVGSWLHQEPSVQEKRDLDGRWLDQEEFDGFDGWVDWGGGMQPEPTHWMPLPPPPGGIGREGE